MNSVIGNPLLKHNSGPITFHQRVPTRSIIKGVGNVVSVKSWGYIENIAVGLLFESLRNGLSIACEDNVAKKINVS